MAWTYVTGSAQPAEEWSGGRFYVHVELTDGTAMRAERLKFWQRPTVAMVQAVVARILLEMNNPPPAPTLKTEMLAKLREIAAGAGTKAQKWDMWTDYVRDQVRGETE